MNSPTIQCPECNADITLSETLAAEHIEAERIRHRDEMAKLKSTYDLKSQAISERETALAKAEQQIQEKVAAGREQQAKQIEQEIRKTLQSKLDTAEQSLADKNQRLQQAEAAELESRKRVEAADEKLRQLDLEVQRRVDAERLSIQQASSKREEALKQALASREEALTKSEQQIAETLAAERIKQAAQLREEISNDMQSQFAATELQLADKDKRLKEAEAFELESRKRMAEADEKLRQSELETQRRIDEQRSTIREQAIRESSEESNRKIAEKDQLIEQMNKRIEALHRQADSKSQQLQGDLEEASVFARLQEHFPADDLVRVPRGRNGADIMLKVKAPSGKIAGAVLIEVKDTQNFDRNWIGKLKTDTQNQAADIGVIVTRAMPGDIEYFAQRDDIWICRVEVLVQLLTAIRNEIQHVCRVRTATALSESARDVVFGYLTSADFTRRVTTMVDGYTDMRTSLDKQKRQFSLRMTEQERALDKMIGGLTGVYGDLSYRAGTALKPVAGLELDDPIEDSQHLLPETETADNDQS